MTTDIVPFQPMQLAEVERLSILISKSLMLPEALRGKPGDVMFVVMAGQELGLPPMVSLRGFNVIQGKPVMSADMMGALCLRRSDVCAKLELVESTAVKATYVAQRKGGQPITMSFTIEDAKAANLTNKDNWRKYPAAMLRARCVAAICRAVFPDICAGLYETSEGEEMQRPVKMPQLDSIEGEVVQPRVVELPSEAFLDLQTAIKIAVGVSELKLLVSRIKQLSEGEQAQLRTLYAERAAALREAEPKSKVTIIDVEE